MGASNSYADRLFDLLLQALEFKELGLTLLEDALWFIEKVLEKTPNKEEREAFSLIRWAVDSWNQSLRVQRRWGQVTGSYPLENTYWKKASKILHEQKKEKLAKLTLAISKLREADNSLLAEDPEKTITLYSEAEEILEKLGKKAALTAKRRRLNIQAEVLYSKQEFEKAAELYFQIAETLEKTGFRAKEQALIRAHELLVLHEGRKENWKKVSEHQMEISKLLRRTGQEQKALIAEYYSYSASARNAEEQKNWELAAKNHLKASETLQKVGSPVSALYAKLNHYICREKAKNSTPEWLEEAEKLVKSARTESEKDPKELESKVKEILSRIEQEN